MYDQAIEQQAERTPLIASVQWHLQRGSHDIGIRCSENYDPQLGPQSALFRGEPQKYLVASEYRERYR
ncbi:hypothetical protein GLAREA_11624 [Glarea lozoyensis ATCC 20868]|uniref:Uncharacterized protein n=1 Tax=Glarea lozoyensis (strain ATCC 20868 / MF5171) TaxID=1116229 RepID=S3DEE9_GLAL2|nr:uncharacterized protein GLAREA_11624 [Glarea lozoyensis ATCC 20868]EPE25043.1 hypothetical protein GLAREA_11624 [Glarea lozoyensis ATCC 20868]